jgi:cytochrome P450
VVQWVANPVVLLFPELTSIPTPWRNRYLAAVAELDQIIYGIVARRRRSLAAGAPDSGDLLDMLLSAEDEQHGRMSDGQLRDELMTLFLAGHETTALALSWTFHLLAQHREVQTRLAVELADVLHGRPPTLADLPQLRYAERVVRESLRLYPPAWSMGREAVQDCAIGGYRIPAGGQVWMIPWSMHRDPRYFDQPERFDPDRWSGDLAERLPKFAYFPFGGGPRLCIGQAFASMEAVLLLCTIFQRFRLDVVPGFRVVPYPGVTLRPRHGLQMRLGAP